MIIKTVRYVIKSYNGNIIFFKKMGVFISWKVVSEKLLSKLSCVCLPLEKLVNEKYFPVKGKFDLIFVKVFSFYFGQKTLSKSCEKFKISYYLLIISNLIFTLWLLYILFESFYFQIHLLKFDLIWFLY